MSVSGTSSHDLAVSLVTGNLQLHHVSTCSISVQSFIPSVMINAGWSGKLCSSKALDFMLLSINWFVTSFPIFLVSDILWPYMYFLYLLLLQICLFLKVFLHILLHQVNSNSIFPHFSLYSQYLSSTFQNNFFVSIFHCSQSFFTSHWLPHSCCCILLPLKSWTILSINNVVKIL